MLAKQSNKLQPLYMACTMTHAVVHAAHLDEACLVLLEAQRRRLAALAGRCQQIVDALVVDLQHVPGRHASCHTTEETSVKQCALVDQPIPALLEQELGCTALSIYFCHVRPCQKLFNLVLRA